MQEKGRDHERRGMGAIAIALLSVLSVSVCAAVLFLTRSAERRAVEKAPAPPQLTASPSARNRQVMDPQVTGSPTMAPRGHMRAGRTRTPLPTDSGRGQDVIPLPGPASGPSSHPPRRPAATPRTGVQATAPAPAPAAPAPAHSTPAGLRSETGNPGFPELRHQDSDVE